MQHKLGIDVNVSVDMGIWSNEMRVGVQMMHTSHELNKYKYDTVFEKNEMKMLGEKLGGNRRQQKKNIANADRQRAGSIPLKIG